MEKPEVLDQLSEDVNFIIDLGGKFEKRNQLADTVKRYKLLQKERNETDESRPEDLP